MIFLKTFPLYVITFLVLLSCAEENHGKSTQKIKINPSFFPKHFTVNSWRFDFIPINSISFNSVKRNKQDYLMDNDNADNLLLNDSSFVKLVDSFLIIKCNRKIDTFTSHSGPYPYSDTLQYCGRLAGTVYVMIFETFGEGMKISMFLVNIETGEVIDSHCNTAYTPSKSMALSYQDWLIYGGSALKLYNVKQGHFQSLCDTTFGNINVVECKWLSEKAFVFNAFDNNLKDTVYFKATISKVESRPKR